MSEILVGMNESLLNKQETYQQLSIKQIKNKLNEYEHKQTLSLDDTVQVCSTILEEIIKITQKFKFNSKSKILNLKF
jgi:hypothetical protein